MAARKKKVVKAPRRTAARSGGLGVLLAAIVKKHGAGSARIIEEEEVKERVSTGIDVLDHYVLGDGGLPVGKILELAGANNTGKTSLAYCIVGAWQRAGGLVCWADPELSFDDQRAKTLGVDVSQVIMLDAETLDALLEEFKTVLAAHDGRVPLLIVWDSVAAAVSAAAEKKAAGERTVGDVAALLSQELKKIIKPLRRKRGFLLALNQTRDNIGVMFGDKTTTPGGNAMKFYASQRLQIFGGKAVKTATGAHIAKIVTVVAIKNRFAAPFRKAKIRLDYATGYNNIWSTVWHAKLLKLIKPREGGFSGPSQEGLATYAQAVHKLKWPIEVDKSAAPPEEDDEDIVIAVDGEDDEPDVADDSEE